MQNFFQNFFTLTGTGIVKGSIYSLIALGYTMVYGVLKLINFAHSEVWVWGAFGSIWAVLLVGDSFGQSTMASILVIIIALAAAMLVSGTVALLLELVAYRRLRNNKAPPLVSLISAIGASFVLGEIIGLRDKIAQWVGLGEELEPYVKSGRENTVMPELIARKELFSIFDFDVTNIDLIIISSALIMMVGLDQFIRRTRLGRGIRAIAMNSEAAALMGVHKDRVIQITFMIGGFMAGFAAVLYLLKIGVVKWNTGFNLGVKAFTAAVLGGIGNIRGALLGGLVLGLAENYGAAILGSKWPDVVAFVLLIGILIFRPTGLLGEALGKARA